MACQDVAIAGVWSVVTALLANIWLKEIAPFVIVRTQTVQMLVQIVVISWASMFH